MFDADGDSVRETEGVADFDGEQAAMSIERLNECEVNQSYCYAPHPPKHV